MKMSPDYGVTRFSAMLSYVCYSDGIMIGLDWVLLIRSCIVEITSHHIILYFWLLGGLLVHTPVTFVTARTFDVAWNNISYPHVDACIFPLFITSSLHYFSSPSHPHSSFLFSACLFFLRLILVCHILFVMWRRFHLTLRSPVATGIICLP